MIFQCIPTSVKAELLSGMHNFSASGGDVFKIALYSSSASLGLSTTAYTASGEISGTGYTAGGKTLTNVEPVTSGPVACADFSDASWTSASFTCRGALIYNSTNGNRAVAVLDFGSDKTASNGTFTVVFPDVTATTAIIRVS